MALGAQQIWDDYQRLRQTVPLVHSLTNTVVQAFTANALLALGASPLMSEVSEEIDELVEMASALNLNIGTPTAPARAAMLQAARAARRLGRPFVLDPVAVGATRLRSEFVAELRAAATPTVIRGNQAEIATLAGVGWQGRGVDAGSAAPDLENTVREAARQAGTTVVATGETDYLCDGSRLAILSNGHPLLAKVTGTGCVVSAITAAFLAVQPDPLAAGVAAVSTMNVAAELAAAHPQVDGPGSFQVRLVDMLGKLDRALLEDRLTLELK
ncbi:MAG TPA: hydroxyethylthiazole kinase [Chthoniobacterales bacterium]